MQTRPYLWLALPVAGLAYACGGNSSSNGGDSDSSETTTSNGGSGGSAISGSGGTASDTMGTTGSGDGGSATSSTTASSSGGSAGAAGSAGVSGGGSGGLGGSSGSGGAGGTGAAGGSGGSGGTAGSSGAGATGGTTGAGGTGGSGPTGAIGVLGEPCDSPGELACAGNHQKLTVVCGGDGEWEVNQTCSGDQFCDTREGATAGSCQDPVEGCADSEPGALFCDENVLRECGVDTVTSVEVETCAGVCVEGVCNNDKDPCFEGAGVDCAGDCGGLFDACLDDCPHAALFSRIDPLWTMRTPEYDGVCQIDCGSAVRGMVVLTPLEVGSNVRVTVSAPWWLARSDELFNSEVQCDDGAAKRCLIVQGEGETEYVQVFTNDAGAEPRNVVFETVDEGEMCP